MMMTQDKMEKINEKYKIDTLGGGKFKLKVGSSLRGTSIFRDNWEICDLSDLSTMIEELQQLRAVIHVETGIKF